MPVITHPLAHGATHPNRKKDNVILRFLGHAPHTCFHTLWACYVRNFPYLKLILTHKYSFKNLTVQRQRRVTRASKKDIFQPIFICYSVSFYFLFHRTCIDHRLEFIDSFCFLIVITTNDLFELSARDWEFLLCD